MSRRTDTLLNILRIDMGGNQSVETERSYIRELRINLKRKDEKLLKKYSSLNNALWKINDVKSYRQYEAIYGLLK